MSAILDGFRRLADFSGRDRRGRFWPYAAVAVALIYVGLMLAMIPTMATMFGEAAHFAGGNPDQATVVAGPGQYSVQIHDPQGLAMPDFGPFFWVMRLMVAAAAVLLAAAVTRRLHDTGRAGWWGLPPLIFLISALVLFPRAMESVMQSEEAAVGPILLLFANNMLYMASLVGLIVLLALKGTAGPNRYGPEAG